MEHFDPTIKKEVGISYRWSDHLKIARARRLVDIFLLIYIVLAIVLLTNYEEELKDLLCELKRKLSRYNSQCSSHEYHLGLTEQVINLNNHVINRESIHKYFKERFQDDLWCAMEYEDDMLCA